MIVTKQRAGTVGKLLLLSGMLGMTTACETGVVEPVLDASSEAEAGVRPVGTDEALLPSGPVRMGWQWTVTDDGKHVTAENTTLRLRFAYNAQGTPGFKGGGGRDGTITELYYKPTSTTRNLVFRSGPYGGKMDGMDYFQAEPAAVDQMDHNTPDFASGTDARLVSHRVRESAGRLIAEFEFDFQAWRIQRTYIVYPWGDITMHARVTQTKAGRWNYLGRRIHFAVSRAPKVDGGGSRDWGGNYEDDAERYYVWTDGIGEQGQSLGSEYRYEELIRKNVNRNTVARHFGRSDHYAGFMIDDRNGNDPDIVVMNGDPSTWASPFDRIARRVGGKAYIESGMFSPGWAKGTTHAGLNWFYNTIKPFDYSNPMQWSTLLGTWEETFHVMFRSDLAPDDYPALWKARVRDVQMSPPFEVVGATVRFDPTDRLFHLTAHPGAREVRFKWKLPAGAREMEYRTAFVVEKLSHVPSVYLQGAGEVSAENYRDHRVRADFPGAGDVLVVLAGKQSDTDQPFVITVK